jgi:hypothetical protein
MVIANRTVEATVAVAMVDLDTDHADLIAGAS